MKNEKTFKIIISVFIALVLINAFADLISPVINKIFLKINNTISEIKFNFERKDYQPIIFKNELYLINRKNGKTYKFNDDFIGKYKIYSYTYITKPQADSNPLKLAF